MITAPLSEGLELCRGVSGDLQENLILPLLITNIHRLRFLPRVYDINKQLVFDSVQKINMYIQSQLLPQNETKKPGNTFCIHISECAV